jgi:hypothetical protein
MSAFLMTASLNKTTNKQTNKKTGLASPAVLPTQQENYICSRFMITPPDYHAVHTPTHRACKHSNKC